MADRPLNADQIKILTYLRTQPEGACAQWIAEGCGHFYETGWASGRMPTLVRRELVNKLSPGWYQLSKAGHAAIVIDEAQA
jgi:hypothetical protein